MAASPVLAADIPAPTINAPASTANVAQWDGDATNVERHRRWRHRNRVDAGDVIAGVLILGGIAAIASAASNSDDRRSRPQTDRRGDYRDRDSRARTDYRRSNSGEGLDRAVDMCLAEIERDVRVDEVSNVARDRDGWVVSGRIYNGDGFNCRIDNQGQISEVTYSGQQATYSGNADDNQWSDEDYAQARLRTGGVPYQGSENVDYPQADARDDRPDYDDNARPAYPGGPVDGDLAEDGYGG